ncbi:uncharacterized protein (TIRG00374 family) [Clostridiales Family XIII bacterium PM5-7]
MSNKRTLFNLIFLMVCFVATLYYVFHDQNFEELMGYLSCARWSYWLFGVFLVIAFILSESVIIYYMMNSLKQKVKLSHCCLYSFVGFFFSLITPSASGGQPAQIVFMKKDNIPIHVSTLVLLIVTIAYKLVLVIFGLGVLFVKPTTIMLVLTPVLPWVYLGLALNVICVGAMLALVFCPELTRKMVMGCFNLVNKLIHSQRVASFEARIEKSMDGYRNVSEYFQTNVKVILNVIWITILQRCAIFFVTYLVFISFGLIRVDVRQVVVLQAMISVAVDMLPMPGGMGISEHLFEEIFVAISGADLTVPIMIVSRGISYYTQLVISAIFTALAYLVVFKKEKNNDRIL